MSKTISVSLPIYEEGWRSIHVTACEGGINYWADVHNYDCNGVSVIADMEDEDAIYKITPDVIVNGIQRILSGEVKVSPDIAASILREVMEGAEGESNGIACDATDADCIVQAGLFNEVVYG
jgi:hypothetical protein